MQRAFLLFRAICLSGFLVAGIQAGQTLEEYARRQPLVAHTVKEGMKVPRHPGDQTNNFKEDDKLLLLSRKNLTGLDGISRLPVTMDGRSVPLADVKRLHLFLNENDIRLLPAELFSLQNVAWLYLNYNRLDHIPGDIAGMKGLQGI
jgi:hypothetical protein